MIKKKLSTNNENIKVSSMIPIYHWTVQCLLNACLEIMKNKFFPLTHFIVSHHMCLERFWRDASIRWHCGLGGWNVWPTIIEPAACPITSMLIHLGRRDVQFRDFVVRLHTNCSYRPNSVDFVRFLFDRCLWDVELVSTGWCDLNSFPGEVDNQQANDLDGQNDESDIYVEDGSQLIHIDGLEDADTSVVEPQQVQVRGIYSRLCYIHPRINNFVGLSCVSCSGIYTAQDDQSKWFHCCVTCLNCSSSMNLRITGQPH